MKFRKQSMQQIQLHFDQLRRLLWDKCAECKPIVFTNKDMTEDDMSQPSYVA